MPRPEEDERALAYPYTRAMGETACDAEGHGGLVAPDVSDDADLGVLFTRFYQNNEWGSCETRSGPGSERSRMQQVVHDLNKLIREWGIRSMLDAPCGDFNWMQDVSLAGIRYMGCDIVEGLIEINSGKYARTGLDFKKLDLTSEPLPKVDLILCRDALVHFSYKHVFAALRNFRDSGSKYLLTTNFVKTEENIDIDTGSWQPINLQRPPFSFPEPEETLADDSEDQRDDKVLALWDLKEVAIRARDI